MPFLGAKRLGRLTVQDMRGWLNKLAGTCQCCAQDAVTMEVSTHVPSAETRRALRKIGEALGGSKQKKEKEGERKQEERTGERSARDGRQEPQRLLYSAAVRTTGTHSRSREWVPDLCRGGGI